MHEINMNFNVFGNDKIFQIFVSGTTFFILKMREYLDFCKSRMNRKLGVLLLTI